MSKFNLDTYIPVHERLRLASPSEAALPTITKIDRATITMLTPTYGHLSVRIEFSDGSERFGEVGFDLDLEGRSAQATSPIEDAQTSAIGRALALRGYATERGMASREEVEIARHRARPERNAAPPPPATFTPTNQSKPPARRLPDEVTLTDVYDETSESPNPRLLATDSQRKFVQKLVDEADMSPEELKRLAASLRIDLRPHHLTKTEASTLIDALKERQSVAA